MGWQHEELTYILYNKTAVLYGLCCFDPPAPVGGQEGFNQWRVQLFKRPTKQGLHLSFFYAVGACSMPEDAFTKMQMLQCGLVCRVHEQLGCSATFMHSNLHAELYVFVR